MIRKDDRTEEERNTYRWAVVGRDRILSGWGGAEGGYSRAAWAVGPDVNIDRVENWVRNRTDMQYVSVVDLATYRPPRGTAHFHIYKVNTDHVAARY